jgi:hypothetical protein
VNRKEPMHPDKLQHPETYRRVLGRSDEEKKFFVDTLVKHLIETGDGVCIIDPDGRMYRWLLQCLAFCDESEETTPALEDHHE